MIYFEKKQLTFLYEAKKKCLYKIDKDLNLSKVMKADSSIFPGKSLKKDLEENNLFVQNSNSSIIIFTNIMQKGYKQKVEIDDVGFDHIYEFVPLGHDKILVVGAKGEITLIKYLGDFCTNENCRCSNNRESVSTEDKIKCGITCGVQELDFTNLFVSTGEVFEKMEISSIVVSKNKEYIVVSSHCHSTGTKRRLYLVKLGKNFNSIKPVQIKRYEDEEKPRSAYMATNMSYSVLGYPLFVAFEHCPNGSLVSYFIKDDKLVHFKTIENYSAGYIFTCDFFDEKIWTIDSEGEIRAIKLEDEDLQQHKRRRHVGKKVSCLQFKRSPLSRLETRFLIETHGKVLRETQ